MIPLLVKYRGCSETVVENNTVNLVEGAWEKSEPLNIILIPRANKKGAFEVRVDEKTSPELAKKVKSARALEFSHGVGKRVMKC